MIVFVHIPKTGGTSVRTAAEEYFGLEHTLFDYGPEAPRTSPVVRELLYERDDLDGLIAHISNSDIEFLSGHFLIDRYRGRIENAEFVTWVRDPVQRVISLHRHRSRDDPKTEPLDRFCELRRFRNGQAGQVGERVKQLAFVGVLEQHDRSLELLNTKFGIELVGRRDNVAASPSTVVDPELLGKIESLNQADYRLVNRAIHHLR